MKNEDSNKRLLKMLLFDIRNFDTFLLKTYLRFFVEYLQTSIRREPDFPSEKFYWARLFHERSRKNDVKVCNSVTSFSPTETAIVYALEALEKKVQGNLSLIDVGSGPFSVFNIDTITKRTNVELVAVDPLADFYEKLHRDFGTGYQLKLTRGLGENLVEIFGKRRFHLAVTENAIDHSTNPVLFLKNLCDLVKPGGYIILSGYFRVGSNEKWHGLHKWDISLAGTDLILTNQTRTIKENITCDLNLLQVEKTVRKREHTWYLIVYLKNGGLENKPAF
jgi:hypothetical protein